MTKTIKAVGLLSGGLDSTIAAAMLMRQGIEVQGLTFYTGFCVVGARVVAITGTGFCVVVADPSVVDSLVDNRKNT